MKLFTATNFLLVSAIKGQNNIRNLGVAPGACDGTDYKPLAGDAIKRLLEISGVADPDAFIQIINDKFTIGGSELIPEATDALYSDVHPVDGKSGDTDFPFGKLKPLATVGEYDKCSGNNILGVPDGMGAYLYDDNTVRVIVQSESYGTLWYGESRMMSVNKGSATYTGSHVQYIDYDRFRLSQLMESDMKASSAYKGMGEIIETVYNLKGELVTHRNATGPTKIGAHDSNVDVYGNWAVGAALPTHADWIFQSLCSAHLEQHHQWGEGVGLEDDLFITNEEWITYSNNADVIGMPAHVIDFRNKISYAVGSFGFAGFEKIVELNPQHTDYVVFSVSGYNGYFDNTFPLAAKNAMGKRDDGSNYVWPKDIAPARIYIGVKGKMEDGSVAPPNDFLARNGFRYGQLYGFATALPTQRDIFHVNASNGVMVTGKWLPINWRWDGKVRPFLYDAAWEFQNQPVGYFGTNFTFWTGRGKDTKAQKSEHNTPDPRPGKTGFAQGSNYAYIGHYYVENMKSVLDSSKGTLPAELDASYYVYQGYKDVTSQIELGGKGMQANGVSAKYNQAYGGPYPQFKGVDGLELIATKEGLRLIVMEDSDSLYGERIFITSILEHESDGKELTYYFIAQSGGMSNTRNGVKRVGVPAGSNTANDSHEFSGVFDLSGLLATTNGRKKWVMKASDDGHAKRSADAAVSTNNKYLMLGLQAHNLMGGIIAQFGADRGGQWLLYKPQLPVPQ